MEKKELFFDYTHRNWILINSNSQNILAKILEFHSEEEITYKEINNYIYSHFRSSKFPEISEKRQNKFIAISPVNSNKILVTGEIFNDLQKGYTLLNEISLNSSFAFSFYIDVHGDYENFAISENGKMKSIWTRDGENVKIQGEIDTYQSDFINKYHYYDWPFEKLIEVYSTIKLDFRDTKYINGKWIVVESKIRELNDYSFNDIEVNKFNIWNDEYMNKSDTSSLNWKKGELPF